MRALAALLVAMLSGLCLIMHITRFTPLTTGDFWAGTTLTAALALTFWWAVATFIREATRPENDTHL